MTDAAVDEKDSLDDVLLAMDVVDTLRHRERVVDRELSAAEREAELVGRLKEIYAAQGIEVPERILKDGVKALEERRFAYEPPKPSLSVRLAKIYVSRDKWVRPVVYGLAGLAAIFGALQVAVFGPQRADARAAVVALERDLPAQLEALRSEIAAVVDDDDAEAAAAALARDMEAALAEGDRRGAEAAAARLAELRDDLRTEYEVRIVSRPGEFTGFFRVPEGRPGVRNHYLVVEAIDPAGRVIEVPVVSEETQEVKRVSLFAVRVGEAEFSRVADDKADDQIVQDAVIGRKAVGRLRPAYTVETTGAGIFEW
ncbi:MAG: DUF6384 family protein [Pseudomonadota bacterium]